MPQNLSSFLAPCEVVDCQHPAVLAQAQKLEDKSARATAERCFTFVRDQIRHSSDYQLNPVTCAASEVLEHLTGYCYAKSHLLVALLRANEIPAGLCYQRLSIDGLGAPFCLHGLVAVYLPDDEGEAGWYRIDPRGNRSTPTEQDCSIVNAQFTPPVEQLAFSTDLPGEYDLPGIHSKPLPEVVTALQHHSTWDALLKNLPDATTPPPQPS